MRELSYGARRPHAQSRFLALLCLTLDCALWLLCDGQAADLTGEGSGADGDSNLGEGVMATNRERIDHAIAVAA